MKTSEISNILKGRSVAYNIFSRVFKDVPDEEDDRFYLDTAEMLLAMLPEDDEDVARGGELLRSVLIPSTAFIERRHDRVIDYTGLFVMGRYSVPIYESVYTSPQKLTRQDSWSQVKAFYNSRLFKVKEEDRTMEDHISLELQFSGLLSERAAAQLQRGEVDEAETSMNAQMEFNSVHLSNWAFRFCDCVIKRQEKLSSDFYPAYAHLLKGFLREDMEFLKELTE